MNGGEPLANSIPVLTEVINNYKSRRLVRLLLKGSRLHIASIELAVVHVNNIHRQSCFLTFEGAKLKQGKHTDQCVYWRKQFFVILAVDCVIC